MVRRLGDSLAVCAVVIATAIASAPHDPPPPRPVIGGPYTALLDASRDLGPSHRDDVQLTVALRGSPHPLRQWADEHGLGVRWRPGDDWAIVDGPASAVSAAFDVPVHDYRGRRGQEFYASASQPSVPRSAGITAVGRVLGYTPHREATPPLPLDVPLRGLTPPALLEAYNANPLVQQGFTGRGQTIVIFAFGGFDQTDLDEFATASGLPPLQPTIVGGLPEGSSSETVMDLQVAHAVAPDARKVVVNARPTLEGGRTYELIGQMFDDADRDFPGAVWSLSIGWGCDALITATDLKPVEAALERAQANGTSAFDASGDTGGLECKGGADWSAPPGPDDVGLDAVASLPAMTSVGGTTLSTDADGRWLAEQAWVDSPLSQGTSGGPSRLFPRPLWQRGITIDGDTGRRLRRLTPDISAVADPFTGVRIRFDGQDLVGAGTSQAAPIWAGLTALMNQYLIANGGRPLGALNPLLYRVAAGANSPGFRDVSLGGNAVDLSRSGYDLVTGLGSPNIDALARDFLDIQRGTAPR
jgi:kumamolisin